MFPFSQHEHPARVKVRSFRIDVLSCRIRMRATPSPHRCFLMRARAVEEHGLLFVGRRPRPSIATNEWLLACRDPSACKFPDATTNSVQSDYVAGPIPTVPGEFYGKIHRLYITDARGTPAQHTPTDRAALERVGWSSPPYTTVTCTPKLRPKHSACPYKHAGSSRVVSVRHRPHSSSPPMVAQSQLRRALHWRRCVVPHPQPHCAEWWQRLCIGRAADDCQRSRHASIPLHRRSRPWCRGDRNSRRRIVGGWPPSLCHPSL